MSTASLQRSGVYRDQVLISAFPGHDFRLYGNSPLVESALNISITVPEVTEISFVSKSLPFHAGMNRAHILFPAARKGEMQGLDLKVRSNLGYRLKVSSSGNSLLKPTRPGSNARISYSLIFNESRVDLSNSKTLPTQLISNDFETSPEGQAFSAKIILDDVSKALAGTFEDTLTFQVESR